TDRHILRVYFLSYYKGTNTKFKKQLPESNNSLSSTIISHGLAEFTAPKKSG
ncbi:hypothetical protein X975_16011, partial [Stegodyphus mimosarum]